VANNDGAIPLEASLMTEKNLPRDYQNRSASSLALKVRANLAHARVILRFFFILRAQKDAPNHCGRREATLLLILD
jgi:hypothetical protein